MSARGSYDRISVLWILPAVFIAALLTGMAQGPGSNVPTPEIDFKATVRDDQEIETKVSNASWDGRIFFSGMRGKGTVTISFENVRKVSSVGTFSGHKKDFRITLKNGDVVAVSFDDDAVFAGITNFGTYRIMSKNIKEIIFGQPISVRPPATRPKPTPIQPPPKAEPSTQPITPKR
jgi:hypothetical protein